MSSRRVVARTPRRALARRLCDHEREGLINPKSVAAAQASRGTTPTYGSDHLASRSSRYNAPKTFFKPSTRREDRHFKVSPEVNDALQTRKPVVALETTIYTHGFPYPDNVALALDLESIVRRNGGVPATIGILDGVARVGMTTEQLRDITASAGKPETMKVSRRDIPYILGLVSHTLA